MSQRHLCARALAHGDDAVLAGVEHLPHLWGRASTCFWHARRNVLLKCNADYPAFQHEQAACPA